MRRVTWGVGSGDPVPRTPDGDKKTLTGPRQDKSPVPWDLSKEGTTGPTGVKQRCMARLDLPPGHDSEKRDGTTKYGAAALALEPYPPWPLGLRKEAISFCFFFFFGWGGPISASSASCGVNQRTRV